MLSSWKKLRSKASGQSAAGSKDQSSTPGSPNISTTSSTNTTSNSIASDSSSLKQIDSNSDDITNSDLYNNDSRKTITKKSQNTIVNQQPHQQAAALAAQAQAQAQAVPASASSALAHINPLTHTPTASSAQSSKTMTSAHNIVENFASLTLNSDSVITAELSNNDPVMVAPSDGTTTTGGSGTVGSGGVGSVHPAERKISDKQQEARPGLLTVKIYNGNNLKLPLPLKINKAVLSKLASSGVGIDMEMVDKSIDHLLFVAENSQDYANTDVGLLMTQSLPSLISISNNFVNLNNGNSSGSGTTKKALIYLIVEFDNNTEVVESIGNTVQSPKFDNVTVFDVSNSLQYLNIQVFARLPEILIPEDQLPARNGTGGGELGGSTTTSTNNSVQHDILIGNCRIPLNENGPLSSNARLVNHEWINIISPYNKLSMGFINLSIDFKYLEEKKSLTINDFDLLKVIGKGSFGKVMQVRKKDTGKIYALKTIRKSHIVSKMEVTHTLAEKFVLSRVNNPFIVPLKFAFQSPEKLYLVLSFINGGELFYHLQISRRFSLNRAKLYISELLSAIECLHNMNIIYRDLKPENILLDYRGHIALCDFGLCKINMKIQEKTNTFCGTPEYLAPELLLAQGYTRVVDYWTLGILLYEMLTGLPPFYDEDTSKMYKKILQDPLVFPEFLDSNTKSLIEKLLNRDPTKRLGYNGTQEIKQHPFFDDIDWEKLLAKGYVPPFKPPVKDLNDTTNFDPEFTNERPADSVVDDFLSESVQKQFGGWTYVGNDMLGSAN